MSLSLSIEGARQLLAKPKPETKPDSESASDADGDEDDDADADADKDEVSLGATPGADKVVADLGLDSGDMFEVLKTVYDQDELADIAKMLATHLGMTLVPVSYLQDLPRALTAEVSQPPNDAPKGVAAPDAGAGAPMV